MAFAFRNYPAVHSVESGTSAYADAVNHCRDYKSFMVAGDKPSSAHECTHGANSDIRNANGASLGVTVVPPWTRWTDPSDRPVHGLPVLLRGDAGARVNAFYCLKDRAAVLEEPAFRKRDIVEFVPQEFKQSRYSLYVAGQQEWDDCPLYVFDEWTAYVNGGTSAVELGKAGELKAGTDWVFGPVEFVAYGLAVCMAADKRNLLSAELAAFARFQLVRSFNVYLDGKDIFPFGGQKDIYRNLKDGSAGSAYRDIMKKLDFAVPDRVQPEDGDDRLDPSLFKVVG